MTKRIRIGLIGAGANTRSRHIPGLLAIEGVEIAAVCNRRRESTQAVAREFNVPRLYDTWEQLVADPELQPGVLTGQPDSYSVIGSSPLAFPFYRVLQK